MLVKERFILPDEAIAEFEGLDPMTEYGKFLFYRTYSLSKSDGTMESWFEVCKRVTEGIMSIRLDHYMRNNILWEEDKWVIFAKNFFRTLFNMYWSPPGRGLFKMGTEFVYERGSMALNNCFAGETKAWINGEPQRLDEYVGYDVTILTKNGNRATAKVQSFGVQKLWNIVLRGNVAGTRHLITATRDHRWFLSGGQEETFLETGDVLEGDLWTVESITDSGRTEEVYCVVEPTTHSFLLEHKIPTGNCGYTHINMDSRMADDFGWMMDALMLGVGVGFEKKGTGLQTYTPAKAIHKHVIADSREGWWMSVRDQIRAYTIPNLVKPNFDYSKIRAKGKKISGFGGKASGPDPLIKLHKFIDLCFNRLIAGEIDETRLIADIGNAIGDCVVSGNVRRSAEIIKGSIHDETFLNLKLMKDRADIAGMSNNTVNLEDDDDFDKLSELTERVIKNGEPGLCNLRNFPIGRVGRPWTGRPDRARGLNPCGEITLEDKELCCLAETYPTNGHWEEGLIYATFYANTCQLLPCHRPETNRVVARNRRIGIGIAGFTDWATIIPMHQIIPKLREGYDTIHALSQDWADEAGVPAPIKITTIKPGGTVPPVCTRNDLPGDFDSITSGCGYPTFKFCGRRVNVPSNSPLVKLLRDAGVQNEPSVYSKTSTIFIFPIKKGPAKDASHTNVYQQMNNIVLLQHEWSDNAVSNTIYFRPKWRLEKVAYGPFQGGELDDYLKQCKKKKIKLRIRLTKSDGNELDLEWHAFDYKEVVEIKVYHFDANHEEDHLEYLLSSCVGRIKSLSLLPISGPGVYQQMPEFEMSERDWKKMRKAISHVDYSLLRDMEVEETDKYCEGEGCVIPTKPLTEAKSGHGPTG